MDLLYCRLTFASSGNACPDVRPFCGRQSASWAAAGLAIVEGLKLLAGICQIEAGQKEGGIRHCRSAALSGQPATDLLDNNTIGLRAASVHNVPELRGVCVSGVA